MKKLVICLSILGILALLQCAALAQKGDIYKYVQPPNTELSYDYASSGIYVMFDDWTCPDGRPITDVHWWGSYWTSPGFQTLYSDTLANGRPGGIDSFIVAIFSDVAADDPSNEFGFSHPNLDNMLWFGQFTTWTESFDYTIVKSQDVNGNPLVTEDVYQYGVNLSDGREDTGAPSPASFAQEQGKIYWLGIYANMPQQDGVQWGWHETSVHVDDYAVQSFIGDNGPDGDWYIPCGGRDMAFAFTTVPEPGSLMALGSGLFGLAAFALRRRRSR